MDRFGGRDTQEQDLAFHENETLTSNFPSRSILGGFGADRDVFAGDFERSSDQFVFDTEYLQRQVVNIVSCDYHMFECLCTHLSSLAIPYIEHATLTEQ